MKEIFLLLMLLLLAGCQMQDINQYAKVYCKNQTYENTKIKVKQLPDGNYSVDCRYDEADMLEEIQVVNKTADDRFVIKIKG